MTLLLRGPNDLPAKNTYDKWLAVECSQEIDLDRAHQLVGTAPWLEDAFLQIKSDWAKIGRQLQSQPTGHLALTPTCSSFGSDFGVMLAWSKICSELTSRPERILLVCGDPWLFRHLAKTTNINAGSPLTLGAKTFLLHLRGFLTRLRLLVRLFWTYKRLRRTRDRIAPHDSILLVYGHPESGPDGRDAYFGSLMHELPHLRRVLHTDANHSEVIRLMEDPRTASLHAWGNPHALFKLLFARWKPKIDASNNRWEWLIRRAKAIENSGGGPAMNLWQHVCQQQFLAEIMPSKICWPWENHGWERNLCRSAKLHKLLTIGYQHTVVGPHQFNYAVGTNADNDVSIPDYVVCNGPAYKDDLIYGGLPVNRLKTLGAFRFERPTKKVFDPNGSIFIPLSAIHQAARLQLEAAQFLALHGTKVLVKAHPMYPIAFKETETLQRTNVPLREQKALRMVLFTTGTSGLDAVLAGVPAVRLQSNAFVSIDIMPQGFVLPTTSIERMSELLADPPSPIAAIWDDLMLSPDIGGWRDLLGDDKTKYNNSTNKRGVAVKL